MAYPAAASSCPILNNITCVCIFQEMSTKESSESTKSKGRRQRKNKKSPHEDEKNSRGQAADTKVVVFSEKQFFALKQQESHAGPAGAAGGMLPPHLSTDFPSLSPGPEQPGSPQPLITSCWGRSNTLLDPFPRLGCSPCNPPDTVQDSSPLVPSRYFTSSEGSSRMYIL